MEDFLKEIIERLKAENEEKGIMWPFLFATNTGRMLHCKLIKTSRNDDLNVCWAAVDPTSFKPNGVFFSANSEKHEALGVHERMVPFQISDIALLMSESGEFMIRYFPYKEDYQRIFSAYNAMPISNKEVLR